MLEPSLMVIGIGFRTAQVAIRERFWIGQARLRSTLANLAEAEGIEEVVVLSTCERTEFLIWANDPGLAANSVLHLLSSEFSLQLCEWKHFYRLLNEDALAHLFRLSAGLDSILLGSLASCELHTAWELGQQFGSAGKCLSTVLQKALEVGEWLRTYPGTEQAGVSVASVALDIAKQLFGSLERRRIVLLGSGRLAQLTANCAVNQGVSAMRIVNRSLEHAIDLAHKIGGNAAPLRDLTAELLAADVVICCASTQQILLRLDQIDRLVRDRKEQHLCIIDLALPRNVEAGVREVPGVFLYDLDDIQKALLHDPREQNLDVRRSEELAAAEAREFCRKLSREHATPMIAAVRECLDRLCHDEIETFQRERGPFSKQENHRLTELTSRITQRLASALVKQAKEVPETVDQEHIGGAIHRLLHLETEKTVPDKAYSS